MIKLFSFLLPLLIFVSCNQNQPTNEDESGQAVTDETEMLADSVLHFRHRYEKSDILSRRLPNITREEAIEIQLAMLEKELSAGARQIGWKMGGTATPDSAKYDPVFGYILDKNLIKEDSVVSPENFPGGQVMVEGEVGFVMKKDFENGAQSIEELQEGIDYVVGAVEFAQGIAIPLRDRPESATTNHALASGMGHAGILLGAEKADLSQFDLKNETVRCFINGELVAEGVSSNVYNDPLHALYSLVNLLPKYGKYLKKGDVIVTGSMYQNPTIDSTCTVRLEYSTLGTINFSMK